MVLGADVVRIVDAALDATAVVGPELQLLTCNHAFAKLTGLRHRELRVSEPRELCHQNLQLESCATECLARRVWRTREAAQWHQIRGRAGMVLIVAATPLLTPQGEPYAVMETYRDVTAETRMQARFKALLQLERDQKDKLQSEVEKRTAELSRTIRELSETRDHLIQMEKMLTIGLLVAGVAHEINNPINFIYGNLDFLERHIQGLLQLLDESKLLLSGQAQMVFGEACERVDLEYIRHDLPKLVNALRSGSERVVNIVRDFRAFSYSGQTTTSESIDLTATLNTTLNLVDPQAKKRRVKLHRAVEPLPIITCNPSQVNQVVMNLVVNAIQAVAEEGNVWVRARGEPGGLVLEVQDDGPGIAPERQNRVFDPFFTTKEAGKGTGLGLSISLGIIRNHGGDLELKSEVGQGTTFRIWLPAAS